jgi:AcrR family transcriptional regulator
VGRPKEHDARTAVALLDAAELLVSAQGPRGLSMRAVADQVGTTTRAIYSLFGSKDGLITALGVRAFDLLGAAVNAVPVTEDPAADLVAAGVEGFRRLFIDHPALFRLGVQQIDVTPAQLVEIRVAAQRAWVALQTRVDRLQRERRLASVEPYEAAKAFHALCEGLAALELRGFVSGQTAEHQWRTALTALVTGFGSSAA